VSGTDAIVRTPEDARRLARAHGWTRPAVIGLAGGIGSGKSAVARALAFLGCVVSDSDTGARAALDRPDVLGELVSWWGPGVRAPAGGADRRAIASIVFERPGERARLEALIHPILHAERSALLNRAQADGAAAVVIDAPLLFEAGLDAQCDAVVFVDAPREQRLERVRASRGWDEAELLRREKAQWELDRKRSASDHVVVNDASEAGLTEQVGRVFGLILEAGPRVRPRPSADAADDPSASR
jgi:dephospho-CoA kinase